MNNKIKSEKYRKLSIAALVTSILAYGLGIILSQSPLRGDIFGIIVWGLFVLLIAAVVCGSIDLKKIQTGRNSKKGRGFDIAGIVLGGIPILILLVYLPLEFIFPH